jgi:hypothetical protein
MALYTYSPKNEGGKYDKTQSCKYPTRARKGSQDRGEDFLPYYVGEERSAEK